MASIRIGRRPLDTHQHQRSNFCDSGLKKRPCHWVFSSMYPLSVLDTRLVVRVALATVAAIAAIAAIAAPVARCVVRCIIGRGGVIS